MSDESPLTLDGGGNLAFFGKITASVSHELNNVMSIIEQTTGLIEDLCAGAAYGKPLSPEKLQEIATRVIKQVDRGAGIIKRLNYFAHSIDDPVKTFEANILVANLVELCQRFTAMKKVALECRCPDQVINLHSSPFALEHAIFLCIHLVLTASASHETISVELERCDGGAQITVIGSPILEGEETQTHLKRLAVLLRLLQGSMQHTGQEGRSIFQLTVVNLREET
ncbi:MAG: hypothetical protein ABH878_07090 [bacterium]